VRVAEQFAATDRGRQRRANEDALLAKPPLFVVADGMGGAKAGEVASRVAIESLRKRLPAVGDAQIRAVLRERIEEANARIHALSIRNANQAGMGTTLTALHVGEDEVLLAHVGDSRAYLLREGKLQRLTEDHSLVDELVRQGRLAPDQAQDHPQRSVITRALGPEPTVHIDIRTVTPQPGDIYLLCSDGLTSMLSDEEVAEILTAAPTLQAAGKELIRAANAAGGKDNITVILIRLEAEPARTTGEETRVLHLPAGRKRRSKKPPKWLWRPVAALLVLLAILAGATYLASQSIYFIGVNKRGLITIYSGLPYELPGGLKLYVPYYVSGVPAIELPPARRAKLLDNSWRSEGSAGSVVKALEVEAGEGR